MWTASSSISFPFVGAATASGDRKEEESRPSFSMSATNANLYKWAESDAQFLRSLLKESSSLSHLNNDDNNNNNNNDELMTVSSKFIPNATPEVVSQSSMRQKYLRSYKFTTPTSKGIGFGAGGATKRKAGLGVKVDEEKMKKKKKGGFLNNLFGSRFAGILERMK